MALGQSGNNVIGDFNVNRAKMDLMERILLYLYAFGEHTAKNISKNTRISQDNCVEYLEFLTSAELAKKRRDKRGIFGITPAGILFCKDRLGFPLRN